MLVWVPAPPSSPTRFQLNWLAVLAVLSGVPCRYRWMLRTYPVTAVASEPYVAVTDRLAPGTVPRSSDAWLYWLSWLNAWARAAIRRPATLGGGDWTRPPWAAALCVPAPPEPDFDTPAGVMVIVCARPIRFEGQFWLAPGLPR